MATQSSTFSGAYQGALPVTTGNSPSGGDRKTKLDSDENQKRLAKLRDWWDEARELQADARREMAIDEAFVDGDQWAEEDRELMQERNQAPLVFNEILPAMLWIEGTERRTRTDWKILPRSEDDIQDAQTKSEVMKYVSDINRARWARSEAFRYASRAGLGWMEVCVTDDPSDEIIKVRAESWRNIWYDQYATDVVREGRFVFRSKVIDTDFAVTKWPHRKHAIESAARKREQMPWQAEDEYYDVALYQTGNPYRVSTGGINSLMGRGGGRREGVRVVECWYREPARVKVMKGDDADPLNGIAFDPANEVHLWSYGQGMVDLVEAVKPIVRQAIFLDDGGLLEEGPSPYRHSLFPFVPIVGYRKASDGSFYGLTRNARDPQEDLNKRRSKALFILSTNRVIGDKGAVDEEEEANFAEESAKPNAIIWKNRGYDLQIGSDNALADEHVALALQDGQYIRQASGVTAENLGQDSNVISGKGILAKQNQGTVVTATLFDNAREADQVTGEIMLSLIEQFMGEARTIRVTGERGAPKFVDVNVPRGDGTYINDITDRKADFIVAEQDYRESIRMAMSEQLMEMLQKLDPKIALNLLDLAVEMFDLPNKEEMVKRIRLLNGQADPDSPEAQEQAKQKSLQEQQQAAEQADLERRDTESQIAEREAKIRNMDAETKGERVDTLISALEAMLKAMQTPGGLEVAQNLAEDAEEPLDPMPGLGAMQMPGMQPAMAQQELTDEENDTAERVLQRAAAMQDQGMLRGGDEGFAQGGVGSLY